MVVIDNIRGMLLEEAVLYLLRASGYKTVDDSAVDEDPTLSKGSAGIEVQGRGEKHQIDAIADFMIAEPFSYPQRLLVEAKCLSGNVGLPVVRNAVGVLKDVQEYWVPQPKGIPSKSRYSYRYAVFSAEGFSPEAQRYAYAQDIYLVPFARSIHMHRIIRVIDDAAPMLAHEWASRRGGFSMSERRAEVRRRLRSNERSVDRPPPDGHDPMEHYVYACGDIGAAILVMTENAYPVFLVPERQGIVRELEDVVEVEVRRAGRQHWYLSRSGERERLFSFDVPVELLQMYERAGRLSPLGALDLKERVFSQFRGFVVTDDTVRVVTFKLDKDWLERLRRRLSEEDDGPARGGRN